MMSGWFQSIFQRDTIIKAGQNIILHWMLDARQIASPGLAKTKRWMDLVSLAARVKNEMSQESGMSRSWMMQQSKI